MKKQTLETGVFTMGQGAGSRVETRRFQAMGQLDWIQLVQPAPHHTLSCTYGTPCFSQIASA
jgi:hypothetical protein